MTKLRMKIVPPGRINSLALHMDAEEIALRTGMTLDAVLAVLRRDSRATRWVARCNITGRRIQSHTERGAYLRAQIEGFADWDLFGEAKV